MYHVHVTMLVFRVSEITVVLIAFQILAQPKQNSTHGILFYYSSVPFTYLDIVNLVHLQP